MKRYDIIQSIINKIKAKKYLEIGVSEGDTFNRIQCEYKVGVDPNPESVATHYMDSDTFFEHNKETFDVIFIDGLHFAGYVYFDIMNALKVLNPNGYIVCHDMNPKNEKDQIVGENITIDGIWNGDCWKAFVQIRRERDDLSMCVVDTDFGCGIIKRGRQQKLNISSEDLEFSVFTKNRVEWLNLISPDTFMYDLLFYS